MTHEKTGENVEKYGNVKVPINDSQRKKLTRKPLFRLEEEIIDSNNQVGGYEINMGKAKVEDDKPLHTNVAILQHSKILFINFMYWLKVRFY